MRAHCPETAVLVLTTHDVDGYLAAMVEAGAAGFLTKEEAPQRLVEAIRCAARGDVLITGGQLARANHWREEVGARWESLTEREHKVLQLLAEGLDNAAIAEALWVSVNTVRCHISHIYSKLGVADRAEAIVFVLRHESMEI
ncbi:MAG: response regulator transcription factor [Chloroflexota bacterium]|nr:response regulator transcription factor [Chloroflexota bacterium]